MIDISTIKLIIWDLDDTFWQGTLSEGGIHVIPYNIQLIKDTTDCGIINSICSRNEAEPTIAKLQELGIYDYFVFTSINWENKASRLKRMIKQMALREQNVLFIDDNPFNLKEAQHYLPQLQTALPEVIDSLIKQVAYLPKKDKEHKRLSQYKLLENKAEAQTHFDNNEAFLFDSQIHVTIKHDCLTELARLHELIMRSNQLNYTKKRISEDELRELLQDKAYECGYVHVQDRFGDYGIVGFYALQNNHLEHFVFSCRTMGQLVEQWVYAQLGFPELETVGEVRTLLNKYECPAWINQESNVTLTTLADNNTDRVSTCKILLKGPCDLSHAQSYIKNAGQIHTEFTYVDDTGRIIDAYNHSVHIKGLAVYTQEQKLQLAKDCIFIDPKMLEGTFFTGDYDVIFLSALIESIYGIYQRKGTDLRVVFSNYTKPITDPNNWADYCSGRANDGHNKFTEDYLQMFSEQYEFLGLTTPSDYQQFLQFALEMLPPKTTLCIILGTTFPHNNQTEWAESHQQINDAVKALANNNPRLRYIETDAFIESDNDFTDGSLNHYSAHVYYDLAMAMLQVVRNTTSKQIRGRSKQWIIVDKMLSHIRKWVKYNIPTDNIFYKFAQKTYHVLARK